MKQARLKKNYPTTNQNQLVQNSMRNTLPTAPTIISTPKKFHPRPFHSSISPKQNQKLVA